MKILYITNVRLPTQKAHGVQIMKMCEAFADTGADVSLIVPRLKPAFDSDPFVFYSVRQSFKIKKIFVLEVLAYAPFLGSLASYIQNLSFSLAALIYVLYYNLHRDSIIYSRDYMTLFLFGLFGLSPVAELHDYRSLPYKYRFNSIINRSKKIIVNSTGTLDALKKHYFIPGQKVLVAPNGVDIDFFDVKETKAEARQILRIPQGAPIIAYVGRLETVGLEKGVSELIRAFASLPESNSAYLYIIGGPGELIKRYSEQCRELKIEQRVVFTDQVSYAQVPLYLRAVDIVAIPFPNTKQLATTASPLKIFEFMAAGKVILASDLPSLRSHLDSDSAFFFRAGDVNDMAGKLKYILANQDLANRLSKTVKERSDKYAWKNRAANILKFINE